MPHWLGLDIGGANIKVADGFGYASTTAFSLWREPARLADALRAILASSPPADHLAVTMTGELADCYPTKAEGVVRILEALAVAADRRHTRIYRVDGLLVAPPVAQRTPELTASANWHALAKFACRYAGDGAALLVDIGSTTSDIIPLSGNTMGGGQVIAAGQSDTQRLMLGELVYTGVERSPLCAVLASAPYQGQQCPLAQEFFATTLDVYLTLGDLPSDPAGTRTADGRPATREATRDRLARSICADRSTFSEEDARAMAEAATRSQLAKIAVAAGQVIRRMPSPPRVVVISGQGEFLARRAIEKMRLEARVVSLTEELGPEVSACGPAHAVAVLCREAATK
ncbi:MAG: H4MPT-linked C1 transfer pathway protein [Planctomycetia bacterium]|nr:H4MPT-linked C1 transfer pathway protein [Planctomycetia bacterium]